MSAHAQPVEADPLLEAEDHPQEFSLWSGDPRTPLSDQGLCRGNTTLLWIGSWKPPTAAEAHTVA